MQLFKLNKTGFALVLVMLLHCVNANAQQVLQEVALEKISDSFFKVLYTIKPVSNTSFETVTLKIYRRRSGRVAEVFSKVINSGSIINPGENYSYNWQPNTSVVKSGDQLQARILVTYKKELKATPPPITKINTPPNVDAGDDMEIQLPYNNNITLSGMKSFDEDGRIVYINWQQISGPSNLSISSQHSYKTTVAGSYLPGVYIFELTVTDDALATTTDRVQIIAKAPIDVLPPPAAIPAPPVTIVNTPVKKDSVSKPAIAVKPKPAYEPPPMKGGPGNALINILLPGVGHYFVSGDHYGNNRKPQVLLISALYAGAVGGAVYYKLRSNSEYNKYIDLANFREYQKDANGNIIGVRGVSEAISSQQLAASQNSHKNFLILGGVSLGIMGIDVIYTLIKGSKNKRAWKSDAGISMQPYVLPGTTGTTAGVLVNF